MVPQGAGGLQKLPGPGLFADSTVIPEKLISLCLRPSPVTDCWS